MHGLGMLILTIGLLVKIESALLRNYDQTKIYTDGENHKGVDQ